MSTTITPDPIIGYELCGVRYGTMSSGKVHLARRPMRDVGPSGVVVGESHDSDAYCGRTNEGLSVVWYRLDVLREVGWDDPQHVCKRCLAEVGVEAIRS